MDYDEAKKKQNLWRCDCSDEGEHINVDYHESNCGYAKWYERQDFEDDGDDE